MIAGCRSFNFPVRSSFGSVSFVKFVSTKVSSKQLKTGLNDLKLQESYLKLGLQFQADKDELKARYLELARKYHPDTGGQEANAEKFDEIRTAYVEIVREEYSETDSSEFEDVPAEFDIRHTAPQHRQYLELGGVGYGTPSARYRQYAQYRVRRASQAAGDYAFKKIAQPQVGEHGELIDTEQEAKYARRFRTSQFMDRMVEDLIQESMKRGEFENLSGAGKPLSHENRNPFLDFTTQKINEILVQNGFSPGWVMLEKDIRTDIERIRVILATALKSRNEKSTTGELNASLLPSSVHEECQRLNKQIDRFNLVCPAMSRQLTHLNLDRELRKIKMGLVKVQLEDEPSYGSKLPPSVSSSEGEDANKGLFYKILSALQLKKMGD